MHLTTSLRQTNRLLTPPSSSPSANYLLVSPRLLPLATPCSSSSSSSSSCCCCRLTYPCQHLRSADTFGRLKHEPHYTTPTTTSSSSSSCFLPLSSSSSSPPTMFHVTVLSFLSLPTTDGGDGRRGRGGARVKVKFIIKIRRDVVVLYLVPKPPLPSPHRNSHP
ncbi:hypothetical protein E2C01_048808 [Portunus trituberculatus]|uniref:Uncharacterized protein n=1 Tax=Portunus trituberculatus TaxID=210409 RepID=A0A5B7GB52_PORTR|nr:hypothetical protein [Portunus trituberculatus]